MGSRIEGYGAAAVLRRLARDWYDPEGMHTLWEVLEPGTEEDWEVDPSRPGSVPDLLREIADEVEAEACPEPWPRFDDGEPVHIGDKFEVRGKGRTIRAVYLSGQEQWGIEDELGMTMWLDDGECVKRPSVLAADGKPLKVGQTVYTLNDDRPYTVKRVENNRVSVNAGEGACDVWKAPTYLTHRRPVLDADGVPIHEGDTVFRASDGREFEVTGIDSVFGIRVKDESMEIGVWATPVGFTHTKPELPDSWERIEEDARAMLDDGLHPNGEWVLDLLSRCRALAERERSE